MILNSVTRQASDSLPGLAAVECQRSDSALESKKRLANSRDGGLFANFRAFENTGRPWKYTRAPEGKDRRPTMIFQGRAVKLRECNMIIKPFFGRFFVKDSFGKPSSHPAKHEDVSVLKANSFQYRPIFSKPKEEGRKVFAIQRRLRTTPKNTPKLLNSVFSKQAIMPVANAALDALTATRPGLLMRAKGEIKKGAGLKLQLMEEILHHLGCTKNPANSTIFTHIYHINWLAGFLNHQQYHLGCPFGPKFATFFSQLAFQKSHQQHRHLPYLSVPSICADGFSQLHLLENGHPILFV